MREIPLDPFADWPPVISSQSVPRAIKLRDMCLTLLMWGLLLLILLTELRVAWLAFEVARGRSDAEIDLALAEFMAKLRPLMLVVAGLVVALAFATFASKRRRDAAVTARRPEPLAEAALAALAGLDEAALAQARTYPVVTAFRRHDGGLRFASSPGLEAAAGE
jgi:poly-beta-1,6-N-acetyl-D-glucosamine biosynthesis protein PgaD